QDSAVFFVQIERVCRGILRSGELVASDRFPVGDRLIYGRSYRLAQLRCKHALQGRDLRAVAVGRGKFFEQLVRVGTRRTGKFSCRDQTVEFSDVVIELWFELEHERRRLGSGIEAFQHRIVTILTNLDAVMTEWELLKLKLAFGVGYSSILTVHQNSAS